MRPLLNKDFRRLRWLLRQEPPKSVRDYLTREIVSLTKCGVDPGILSSLRNGLQRTELRMALVISVLCFVSRMRLRDRGGPNGIPLTPRMFTVLYRFFNRAAVCDPTVKRQADMLFCLSEVNRWGPSAQGGAPNELIEQKIIEGFPDLCTHVRARVERLCAFFELPPDLSLPPAPPVRSIWEMPPPAVSPPRPRRTGSYYERVPGFR